MRLRHVGLLATVAIGVALAWSASRLLGSPPNPLLANTLHRGNGSEAETLDPQAARSESALTIARDLFEGLMAVDAAGNPVPAAAERYEISAAGDVYTFHLRPTLRWSNGDVVTAADFVAAWRRLVNPATAAPYAQMLRAVRNAAAIEAGTMAADSLGVLALDETTLVVELQQPTPYFLNLLAHPGTFPLHRASLATHGARFAKPGILVSNGAYVAERWDFGSKILAVRNRHYWNDSQTHIDRVEYHSIAQASAELGAYRSDALDFTSTLSMPQMAWIRANLAAELHVSPQLAVYYYGLNLRAPPFADAPQLRRALSMVIDRERLVESVTGLGEMPAYGLVPPQTRGYAAQLPEWSAWPLQRRVERARAMLRESGVEVPARIELRYNSGELHTKLAVAVASMWKESLGIETDLRGEEYKVLLQDIDRGDGVQVFRASWVADYNDAVNFLQVLRTGFGINLPRYSNASYDAALEAANSSDASARIAHLQRAERMMLEDQPLIPLFFYVNKHLVKPRVHGWRDNVMNIVYSKDLRLTAGE